jgi:hypothetical protein
LPRSCSQARAEQAILSSTHAARRTYGMTTETNGRQKTGGEEGAERWCVERFETAADDKAASVEECIVLGYPSRLSLG